VHGTGRETVGCRIIDAMNLSALLIEALFVVVFAALDDSVASNGLDSFLTPPRLVQDDQCLVPGTEDEQTVAGTPCALSALQRHRSATLSRASDDPSTDHPWITGCHNTTGQQCPGRLVCVTKPDDTWSQCVDCSRQGFLKDCIMMNEEMRDIATEVCGRSCPFTTPRPTISGCNATASGRCPGRLRCAATADGSWSQCVDCSQRHFYKDCQKLDRDMRFAAILTCKKTCLDTQCWGGKWCRRPYKCVGDRTWAQCIKCDAKTFRYRCNKWDAGFRRTAERRCHRRCRRH